jgi:myo-inositol catabolism protein IolS
MEKRRLGSSDLFLSVLGIGCWQFGGGSYWGQQSQEDVNQVVHKALDSGVNYFDTAELYNNGDSEISLGIALQGRRDEAVIGSKIDPLHMAPSKLREHCELSLRRLQTDYIDVYMVHWPVNPSHGFDIREAYGTLGRLKEEGKIRYIGVSNHGISQLKQVRATGVSVNVNELAYNLLSRAIESELLPYCVKDQLGVIAYMPLQQGILSGKYDTLNEIKPLHARTRHFHHTRGEGARHGEDGAEAEVNKALQEIMEVTNELGISMAALSLSWVISNKDIASTIVGSRNIRQLEANIQGVYTKLSEETIAKLNGITGPVLDKLGASPDYYENRNSSRIY